MANYDLRPSHSDLTLTGGESALLLQYSMSVELFKDAKDCSVFYSSNFGMVFIVRRGRSVSSASHSQNQQKEKKVSTLGMTVQRFSCRCNDERVT